MNIKDIGHVTRGSLLIAGTSIGAGMLALPVMTSQAGFFPSITIYLLCWLFMACTGLLFLEICLWMKKDANIITMAESTLGLPGKMIAWCLYLFLFYCLILAYVLGTSNLIVEVLSSIGVSQQWQGQLIFILAFVPIVYGGTRLVGRLNVFLMLGLGISYFIFVYLGFNYVNTDLLKHTHWSKIWTALPITFTAFAYQGTIPTLVEYMHRDVKQSRLAILIGSFLPFIAYVIWQWLILGIVPLEGENSLMEAMNAGEDAVYPLKNTLNAPGVYVVGRFFAFFALITSFFGVSLGLIDFLADGLKIKKTPTGKIILCLLVFIPPLIVAFSHPHLFLIALEYAGGFGCALLLGVLPILMVWKGRYHLKLQGDYHLFGGRTLLGILFAFVSIELICEIIKTKG